mgnify:CR=1 FL=1
MKKFCLVICIFMIAIMVAGCSLGSNQDYIAKQINIDMPNLLTIEYWDDHGGFHGDGEKYAKIEFDNKNGLNILSQIENSNRWNEMPLTENLNLIMYGGIKDNMEYAYNLSEKSGIPEIGNGYWYFIDRHSKSPNVESDIELFSRHSFNFTLAMYDVDNNTLYYYEFDT